MAIQGFDIGLDTTGEIVLDNNTFDIKAQMNNDLRLQLAYDRIKSVSNNWFIDNIGANLEALIGKPCNKQNAEAGKAMITEQLTSDGLWDSTEFYIKSNIESMVHMEYSVFFKIKDEKTEDTFSYEIIATIDLVKGVNIRYGWEPRR
jgi:hypothetical protein